MRKEGGGQGEGKQREVGERRGRRTEARERKEKGDRRKKEGGSRKGEGIRGK